MQFPPLLKISTYLQNKNLRINEYSGYGASHQYHHAFVEGELSRDGINKSKTFNVDGWYDFYFQAQIGGVWNVEENAGNYTCSHLAEVKTANVKTFENEEFYKRLVLSLDHLLKK